MKPNFYVLLVLLANTFCFSFPSFSQTPFVSDSISVYWEQLDGPPGYVIKYGESGGKLFAATERGLYFSTDGGKNWKFDYKLGKHKLLNLVVNEHAIFVIARRQNLSFNSGGTNYRSLECYMFRSTDRGETWGPVFDSHDWFGTLGNHEPKKTELFFSGDSSLFVCISTESISRIWETQNLGLSWKESSRNFNHCQNLLAVESDLAGVWSEDGLVWNGLLAPCDDFDAFQSIPMNQLPNSLTGIIKAAYQDGTFFLFLADRTVFKTTNLGVSWEYDTLHISGALKDVSYSDGDYYFSTSSGIWNGTPFVQTKIYDGEGGSTPNSLSFSRTSSGYWVNSDLLKTMHSTNGGQSWVNLSRGLMAKIVNVSSICGRLVARSTTDQSYALPQYISNPEDGEWELNNKDWLYPLGEANGFSYVYGPPFMRSSDCGYTLDTIKTAMVYAAPEGIVQTGNRIFLWNKLGAPISFSDDNGVSWTEIQLPFDFAVCKGFLASGDSLYFLSSITNQLKLYRSFDIGQTWEDINIDQNIRQIFWNEKKQIVGISEGNISGNLFLSTDNGSSFLQTFSMSDYYPYILDFYVPRVRFPLVLDGLILMQAADGVFATHNEGLTWTRIQNLPFFNFTFQPISGQNITTGGYTEGARFFHANDGYLYAATEAQGIWRTELAPIRDHALVKGSKYGFLKGRLFRDYNFDCAFVSTTGDVPLGQHPLLIQPGNITVSSDANGNFGAALPTGNYTLSTMPPAYHTPNCPSGPTYIVSVDTVTEANIAFQPQVGVNDLCLLFTTPVRARPGFPVSYTVQVSNVGTSSIPNAILTVEYDEQWLSPLSISPLGQFAGNQAIIELPDIAPGQSIVFHLNFNVSTGTPLGINLNFVAYCPVTEDVKPSNNRIVAHQTVTGSYDPNDKTAQPVVAQLPMQPRIFDYLIRFQNTGTDTAFTVIVTDTLDARFDLLSIRNLESSHSFEFRLLEGGVVKWIFRNILLPDSNTNQSASHGYIRFQIETKPDATPGFSIFNDADIFFDFNSPVRTNNAETENPKWVVVDSTNIDLCAGDFWNGHVWSESAALIDTTMDDWSDTIQFTQVTVLPNWEIHLDTLIHKGQPLLGTPIFQDTTIVFQLQTLEGCDSTITWNVAVQTSGIDLQPEQTLGIRIYPNPGSKIIWLALDSFIQDQHSQVQITVMDAKGVVWKSWKDVEVNHSTGIKLDIASLANGIYFISVKSGGHCLVKKLVKI